jgi:nucleoside phosphorylase
VFVLSEVNKIANVFFGTNSFSDIIIVTPITSIYESLFKNQEKIKESCGWWKIKSLKINSKQIDIAKIPQGNSIVDFLNCLPDCKKIILVGYAGGNSEISQIGDIIIPSRAHLTNHFSYSHNFSTNEIEDSEIMDLLYKNDSVFHVQTLTEQDYLFINNVKEKGISCVDMETGLLYSESNKIGHDAISFLIITDLIDQKPFYETENSDFEIISKSFVKTEKLIKSLL